MFIIIVDYSPNEIEDIIRILDEARNNYLAAERFYVERFLDRRHCNRRVMKRICYRIEQGILRKIRKISGLNEVTSLAVRF